MRGLGVPGARKLAERNGRKRHPLVSEVEKQLCKAGRLVSVGGIVPVICVSIGTKQALVGGGAGAVPDLCSGTHAVL